MRWFLAALTAPVIAGCGTPCGEKNSTHMGCPYGTVCDGLAGFCIDEFSLEEGAACGRDLVCKEDLRCNFLTNPGRCQRRFAGDVGVPCSHYEHCLEGLICRVHDGDVNRCGTVPGAGEECYPLSSAYYFPGTGELFPPGSSPCQSGLYCQTILGEPFTCQPFEPAGALCAKDSNCQEGLYCSPKVCDLPCTKGYKVPEGTTRKCWRGCSPRKKQGDCCVPYETFDEGLTCYTVPDPFRVEPFAGNDEPCTIDSDCLINYCGKQSKTCGNP